MVVRILVVLLLIAAIETPDTVTRAEENVTQRVFSECFLYRMKDGTVYIGQPLVSLGMIGVMAFPPEYYLSPSLAERFAPLVNELEKTPDQPDFWWWGMPTPKEKNKPMVLVRLDVRAELRKPRVSRGPEDGSAAVHEITSAKLIYAEFISPEWRTAWDSLNANLTRIVDVSRTAPGENKSKRLAEAIELASQAIRTMVEQDVCDSWRKDVRRIAPGARVVRLFQRRVEGSGIGEWGGQLRDYVTTLKIQPRTPLPAQTPPCPKIELLAKSESAEELLETIRGSWPEAVLDESLIFFKELKRIVYVWQVEDLTLAQYVSLRKQAREELASRETQQTASDAPASADRDGVIVPEWNVTLRPADPALLAKQGLLRGTVVSETSDDGNKVGLLKGDVIVDYERVYDLVMGRFAHFGPAKQLANKARYGGELEVLRGDRLITLTADSVPQR
ncbi:MAG: hypothetical protein H8E44_28040 [Planctomycetes bacterium]|nr:hypothetical protein [Planctomycetota bacterium]